jgi:hypothetical protein
LKQKHTSNNLIRNQNAPIVSIIFDNYVFLAEGNRDRLKFYWKYDQQFANKTLSKKEEKTKTRKIGN